MQPVAALWAAAIAARTPLAIPVQWELVLLAVSRGAVFLYRGDDVLGRSAEPHDFVEAHFQVLRGKNVIEP